MESNHTTDNIQKELLNENKKYFLLLIPIGVISFVIRMIYFEPGIFLTLDSLSYFFYAADIFVSGQLPNNYLIANSFWSIFLSFLFTLFQFENTIEYMDLQKYSSIFLSIITIIPVYFLARKFFEPKYSIICALIFALEPRLIQNSLLGITEPLYILLGTTTILLFLNSNKKIAYISFICAALTAITRSEGQFLFFVISIMFFIRFRNEKLIIPKYFIGLVLFAIILLPILIHQTEVQGNDLVFSRVSNTISYHSQDPKETEGESGIPFIMRGIENFPKYFVWDLIPLFILFVPIGIFSLFRKIDFKKLTLILWGVGISIPAFYAYSIPIQETRYLFLLYPIFCIVSIFAIKKFSNNFKLKNVIIAIIICGIFISSIIFLEVKSIDNEKVKENIQIVKVLTSEPKVINSFYPETVFLQSVILPEKWNDFHELFLVERVNGQSVINSIENPVKVINTEEYFSINEFIEKNGELTHIYVDLNDNRPEFLKDVFKNEKNYEYLVKEYDSSEYNFEYHVKIFRIEK